MYIFVQNIERYGEKKNSFASKSKKDTCRTW